TGRHIPTTRPTHVGVAMLFALAESTMTLIRFGFIVLAVAVAAVVVIKVLLKKHAEPINVLVGQQVAITSLMEAHHQEVKEVLEYVRSQEHNKKKIYLVF